MQHCESRRREANTNTDCCGSVCDVFIVGEVLMCYVNILRRKTTNEDCTNIRATTHRTIETRAKLFFHASGEHLNTLSSVRAAPNLPRVCREVQVHSVSVRRFMTSRPCGRLGAEASPQLPWSAAADSAVNLSYLSRAVASH